jgi:CheY-like chemotaxis protein
MQVTVRVAVKVAESATRTPTILVMSDDPDWRATAMRVLEQEGYRVLEARHAGQALVESTRHQGSVDLLLTDGDQGQRRSDFTRIFRDHPGATLLHLPARPPTRDDLVSAVKTAIERPPRILPAPGRERVVPPRP